jgi:hypothetical protein
LSRAPFRIVQRPELRAAADFLAERLRLAAAASPA